MTDYSLTSITTDFLNGAIESAKPVIILLPVGSVEPHGPHLGLLTDCIISEACAEPAAHTLSENHHVFIAPTVPYGVTDYASGFKGAISIPEQQLIDYLCSVIKGFLNNGVDHLCLINNHLEPDHYTAILKAADNFDPSQCSVACPLKRRWARTLSDEFKRGECHAGQYETAIVMAAQPAGVIPEIQSNLPEVPISLSDKINEGINTFTEMGMNQAYAGAPANASIEEGRELIDKLAFMVVTEVKEALASETV